MPGASMEFNSNDGKPIRRVNVVFEGLRSISKFKKIVRICYNNN